MGANLLSYIDIGPARFAQPVFLAIAALAPFAGLFAAVLAAKREKALEKMSSNPPRQRWAGLQLLFWTIGLVLAFVALARPQWGREGMARASGTRNLVVAVDVSRSMLANDVAPDRLERAKADVADLIDSLEGDRCALVAFRRAGVALCPLTTDRGFLRMTLETLSPDSAPRGATDIGSAVRESLRMISEVDGLEGTKADHSAIVVISDGGDLREGAIEAARLAKERGVPVFTVGIGDPRKGATLPGEFGGVQKYQGKPVVVKLEEELLKAVAEESGGRYVPLATAGTAETTLGAIYRSFLRKVASAEQNEEENRMAERFAIFLLPAIAFLLAGASLSRGRLGRRVRPARSTVAASS